MKNISKEWYLFEGFKSCGFEIDGSEYLRRRVLMNNLYFRI